MAIIRVGVLRGGPSNEHDISLRTGLNIIENLPKHKYRPLDFIISKDGKWLYQGREIEPSKALSLVDVVFIGMHGYYGEDGKLQQFLESHQKPYVGSRVMSSMAAFYKDFSREIFIKAGLKVPPGFAVKRDDYKDILRKAVRELGPPWVIKPAASGSSIGVAIAANPYDLFAKLRDALESWSKVIIEKRLKGREATIGVLENFRGNTYYPFPIIEIIPKQSMIFDYQAKYSPLTREICPGRFGPETKRKAEEIAVLAHQSLGLRHYSRIDMIISGKEIYVLEANTLPGLTKESLFPKSASAVGLEFPRLLDHLVGLALR